MYSSFNARAAGLDLSARETIDLASSTGFAGVDLLIRDLVDREDDPNDLRKRMDDRGLRGGAWPLPVDWRGDAERFAHDIGRLPRYAEAAAVLGLIGTGTWVMPETPDRPADEREREAHIAGVAAFHRERLGTVARILDPFGIRLGLEAIGVESVRTGRGIPFIHRMADLEPRLGPLADLGPNLGVLLDGWHLYAAGETIEAGLAWGVDRVVWVHLADLPSTAGPDRHAMRDRDRGIPGENGTIDCGGLLRRLRAEGYGGPVTVEPMAGCASLAGLSPRATAEAIAGALRSIWPDEAYP
jgi:sugar phosphate isomerase/epimerase